MTNPHAQRHLGWWGVLPPITIASDDSPASRFWLPLSDTALVALGHAIHHSPSADAATDPLAIDYARQALQTDPALHLWALCHHLDQGWVTLADLAHWIVSRAIELFSGGHWLLAAPTITEEHQFRWSRMMAASFHQPKERWSESIRTWLRVVRSDGELDWTTRLPTLVGELGGEDSAEANGQSTPSALEGVTLLHRMARLRERQQTSENCLSQLAEKRKNAAAKQLAYGLSHEINNPLANISARAQALLRDESDPTRAESLNQIVGQVYRAHEMIAGLMFYANPPEVDPEQVDLNTLVIEAGDEFSRPASDASIQLLIETLDHPAVVGVDRMMMLEAIRVLVRNSIEAVGQGGKIVVSLQSQPDAGDPRWLIHVADSGPGLDDEASRHAFDPFYSGREAGRGLGVGLCRAYRVAKLHQATIRLSAGLAGCVATISIPK